MKQKVSVSFTVVLAQEHGITQVKRKVIAKVPAYFFKTFLACEYFNFAIYRTDKRPFI